MNLNVKPILEHIKVIWGENGVMGHLHLFDYSISNYRQESH